MKKTQNRRVIILSDLNTGYFEQAVFYIRAGTNSPEDILVREANNIVKKFSEKYSCTEKNPKKFATLKKCAAILGVFTFCAIILYIFR